MRPIESAELSAYLDGELDAARAQDVVIALAGDAKLRAELEQLKKQDAAWASAASTAISQPKLRLVPEEAKSSARARIVVITMVLVAVRLFPKMEDLFLLGIVLHCAVLVAALAWIVRVMRDDDARQLAH